MSPLILAFVLAAQTPGAAHHSILSNDRPQFPIGLFKEMKLLEDVNLAAIKDPLRVDEFMERAAKQGGLLEVPSGTNAKQLATHKLRGPMFKEIIQVEVTEGDQKGLRGWVAWKALDERGGIRSGQGRRKGARVRKVGVHAAVSRPPAGRNGLPRASTDDVRHAAQPHPPRGGRR